MLLQAYRLRTEMAQGDAKAIAVGQAQVERIFDHFRDQATRLERQTKALAKDLETGKVDAKNLRQRLRAESLKESWVLGFTVAYEPFVFESDRRLYAPYFDSSKKTFLQCEDFYDYTDPDQRENAVWYQAAAESGRPEWVAAYGPAAGSTYAGYSVPFFASKQSGSSKTLLGVVNVAISLTALTDLLNTRFVGRLGAGIMVNQQGVLLAFPDEDQVRAGRTWEELLRSHPGGSEPLYRLARDMVAGKSGRFRFRNSHRMPNLQSGWFFYGPLEPADWRLGVAIFENELYRNEQLLNRWRIWFALTALIGATLLPLVFLKTDCFDQRTWVATVTTFSLGGALVIGYIWWLNVDRRDFLTFDDARMVTDLQGVEELVRQRQEAAEEVHAAPPALIPTRILVRGVEFDGAYHVRVSGSVWQTYRKGEHDGLTRGFDLPEVASDAEAVAIEEEYRAETDEFEVIRWRFRASLRNRFDYSDFPFDTQQMVVSLRHADQSQNVLLVPELASYRLLNSSARPGVHSKLWMPGWNLEGSFFSYDVFPQLVDPGVVGQSAIGETTELRFNLVVRRRFLTPFISYIVPILIVTALLYGVVIMSSPNQDQQSKSGFNVFGVLGTCGAFFFTVALMHIDLRRGIDAEVVTYLESLYLISYVLLVAVSLNSLLFITTDSIWLVEYRDNLLAKLLYWPLFVALMLAVTLIAFF